MTLLPSILSAGFTDRFDDERLTGGEQRQLQADVGEHRCGQAQPAVPQPGRGCLVQSSRHRQLRHRRDPVPAVGIEAGQAERRREGAVSGGVAGDAHDGVLAVLGDDGGRGRRRGEPQETILASNGESLGTAAGLFKGIIGLVLILAANHVAHRLGEQGIYQKS